MKKTHSLTIARLNQIKRIENFIYKSMSNKFDEDM